MVNEFQTLYAEVLRLQRAGQNNNEQMHGLESYERSAEDNTFLSQQADNGSSLAKHLLDPNTYLCLTHFSFVLTEAKIVTKRQSFLNLMEQRHWLTQEVHDCLLGLRDLNALNENTLSRLLDLTTVASDASEAASIITMACFDLESLNAVTPQLRILNRIFGEMGQEIAKDKNLQEKFRKLLSLNLLKLIPVSQPEELELLARGLNTVLISEEGMQFLGLFCSPEKPITDELVGILNEKCLQHEWTNYSALDDFIITMEGIQQELENRHQAAELQEKYDNLAQLKADMGLDHLTDDEVEIILTGFDRSWLTEPARGFFRELPPFFKTSIILESFFSTHNFSTFRNVYTNEQHRLVTQQITANTSTDDEIKLSLVKLNEFIADPEFFIVKQRFENAVAQQTNPEVRVQLTTRFTDLNHLRVLSPFWLEASHHAILLTLSDNYLTTTNLQALSELGDDRLNDNAFMNATNFLAIKCSELTVLFAVLKDTAWFSTRGLQKLNDYPASLFTVDALRGLIALAKNPEDAAISPEHFNELVRRSLLGVYPILSGLNPKWLEPTGIETFFKMNFTHPKARTLEWLARYNPEDFTDLAITRMHAYGLGLIIEKFSTKKLTTKELEGLENRALKPEQKREMLASIEQEYLDKAPLEKKFTELQAALKQVNEALGNTSPGSSNSRSNSPANNQADTSPKTQNPLQKEKTELEASLKKKTELEASLKEKTELEASLKKKTELEASLKEKTGLEASLKEKTELEASLKEKTELEASLKKKTELEASLKEVRQKLTALNIVGVDEDGDPVAEPVSYDPYISVGDASGLVKLSTNGYASIFQSFRDLIFLDCQNLGNSSHDRILLKSDFDTFTRKSIITFIQEFCARDPASIWNQREFVIPKDKNPGRTIMGDYAGIFPANHSIANVENLQLILDAINQELRPKTNKKETDTGESVTFDAKTVTLTHHISGRTRYLPLSGDNGVRVVRQITQNHINVQLINIFLLLTYLRQNNLIDRLPDAWIHSVFLIELTRVSIHDLGKTDFDDPYALFFEIAPHVAQQLAKNAAKGIASDDHAPVAVQLFAEHLRIIADLNANFWEAHGKIIYRKIVSHVQNAEAANAILEKIPKTLQSQTQVLSMLNDQWLLSATTLELLNKFTAIFNAENISWLNQLVTQGFDDECLRLCLELVSKQINVMCSQALFTSRWTNATALRKLTSFKKTVMQSNQLQWLLETDPDLWNDELRTFLDEHGFEAIVNQLEAKDVSRDSLTAFLEKHREQENKLAVVINGLNGRNQHKKNSESWLVFNKLVVFARLRKTIPDFFYAQEHFKFIAGLKPDAVTDHSIREHLTLMSTLVLSDTKLLCEFLKFTQEHNPNDYVKLCEQVLNTLKINRTQLHGWIIENEHSPLVNHFLTLLSDGQWCFLSESKLALAKQRGFIARVGQIRSDFLRSMDRLYQQSENTRLSTGLKRLCDANNEYTRRLMPALKEFAEKKSLQFDETSQRYKGPRGMLTRLKKGSDFENFATELHNLLESKTFAFAAYENFYTAFNEFTTSGEAGEILAAILRVIQTDNARLLEIIQTIDTQLGAAELNVVAQMLPSNNSDFWDVLEEPLRLKILAIDPILALDYIERFKPTVFERYRDLACKTGDQEWTLGTLKRQIEDNRKKAAEAKELATESASPADKGNGAAAASKVEQKTDFTKSSPWTNASPHNTDNGHARMMRSDPFAGFTPHPLDVRHNSLQDVLHNPRLVHHDKTAFKDFKFEIPRSDFLLDEEHIYIGLFHLYQYMLEHQTEFLVPVMLMPFCNIHGVGGENLTLKLFPEWFERMPRCIGLQLLQVNEGHYVAVIYNHKPDDHSLQMIIVDPIMNGPGKARTNADLATTIARSLPGLTVEYCEAGVSQQGNLTDCGLHALQTLEDALFAMQGHSKPNQALVLENDQLCLYPMYLASRGEYFKGTLLSNAGAEAKKASLAIGKKWKDIFGEAKSVSTYEFTKPKKVVPATTEALVENGVSETSTDNGSAASGNEDLSVTEKSSNTRVANINEFYEVVLINDDFSFKDSVHRQKIDDEQLARRTTVLTWVAQQVRLKSLSLAENVEDAIKRVNTEIVNALREGGLSVYDGYVVCNQKTRTIHTVNGLHNAIAIDIKKLVINRYTELERIELQRQERAKHTAAHPLSVASTATHSEIPNLPTPNVNSADLKSLQESVAVLTRAIKLASQEREAMEKVLAAQSQALNDLRKDKYHAVRPSLDVLAQLREGLVQVYELTNNDDIKEKIEKLQQKISLWHKLLKGKADASFDRKLQVQTIIYDLIQIVKSFVVSKKLGLNPINLSNKSNIKEDDVVIVRHLLNAILSFMNKDLELTERFLNDDLIDHSISGDDFSSTDTVGKKGFLAYLNDRAAASEQQSKTDFLAELGDDVNQNIEGLFAGNLNLVQALRLAALLVKQSHDDHKDQRFIVEITQLVIELGGAKTQLSPSQQQRFINAMQQKWVVLQGKQPPTTDSSSMTDRLYVYFQKYLDHPLYTKFNINRSHIDRQTLRALFAIPADFCFVTEDGYVLDLSRLYDHFVEGGSVTNPFTDKGFSRNEIERLRKNARINSAFVIFHDLIQIYKIKNPKKELSNYSGELFKLNPDDILVLPRGDKKEWYSRTAVLNSLYDGTFVNGANGVARTQNDFNQFMSHDGLRRELFEKIQAAYRRVGVELQKQISARNPKGKSVPDRLPVDLAFVIYDFQRIPQLLQRPVLLRGLLVDADFLIAEFTRTRALCLFEPDNPLSSEEIKILNASRYPDLRILVQILSIIQESKQSGSKRLSNLQQLDERLLLLPLERVYVSQAGQLIDLDEVFACLNPDFWPSQVNGTTLSKEDWQALSQTPYLIERAVKSAGNNLAAIYSEDGPLPGNLYKAIRYQDIRDYSHINNDPVLLHTVREGWLLCRAQTVLEDCFASVKPKMPAQLRATVASVQFSTRTEFAGLARLLAFMEGRFAHDMSHIKNFGWHADLLNINEGAHYLTSDGYILDLDTLQMTIFEGKLHNPHTGSELSTVEVLAILKERPGLANRVTLWIPFGEQSFTAEALIQEWRTKKSILNPVTRDRLTEVKIAELKNTSDEIAEFFDEIFMASDGKYVEIAELLEKIRSDDGLEPAKRKYGFISLNPATGQPFSYAEKHRLLHHPLLKDVLLSRLINLSIADGTDVFEIKEDELIVVGTDHAFSVSELLANFETSGRIFNIYTNEAFSEVDLKAIQAIPKIKDALEARRRMCGQQAELISKETVDQVFKLACELERSEEMYGDQGVQVVAGHKKLIGKEEAKMGQSALGNFNAYLGTLLDDERNALLGLQYRAYSTGDGSSNTTSVGAVLEHMHNRDGCFHGSGLNLMQFCSLFIRNITVSINPDYWKGYLPGMNRGDHPYANIYERQQQRRPQHH